MRKCRHVTTIARVKNVSCDSREAAGFAKLICEATCKIYARQNLGVRHGRKENFFPAAF